MNYDSFILFAGNPYAFPNAGLFLLATLAGAAAELIERRGQKNSRFLFPTALGATIGLAAGILLMLSGDQLADGVFPIWCAAGVIGGFLGAAVVKSRKKRKNVESSEEESPEKSISAPEKKNRKALKIAIYLFGLLCAFALGAFSVFAMQVAGRCEQAKKFYKNSEAFQNAFERGAYANAIPFACACEAAGRDFPNNEMFLQDAHLMKAFAYEMAGDYAAASKSYAAYKFFSADQERGCVVTAEPRLAYKEGKRRKAFRGYCELFALEEEGLPSGKPTLNRLRFPKIATSTILLLDYAEKDRVLTPFAEYSDFLTFMEAEFKAQGEPAEYAEATEFLRSCAKEANGAGGERKPAVADETNDDVAR